MSRVNEVMNKLTKKFQPEAAKGLTAVFQINIDDEENYILNIADQQCQMSNGEHPDPDITLLMDANTFVDIVDGDLGGTSAYMTGRLRAEGNVMLATKLGSLFKRR